MTKTLLCSIFLFLNAVCYSQTPQKLASSEIYQQIKSLNFLGNVLYIAAHPDDENTSLITYFSKQRYAKTTYLSLTRGDGGQNLMGSELGEKLGIIRTQELLKARTIDGGQQWFSRAIDFGYSKTPEETLNIWDKEKILSDVVWAIRTHRPDIIINRFNHRTSGGTHGHHTSSAILSTEAFDLAGQSNKFTSQLGLVEPWSPKRAFFNTSWWFYGSQEAFDKADKTNFIELEINAFYPLEGLSNNEISALSRSQHKSQGFGNTGSRGEKKEYIELIKGEKLAGNDPFHGIDTSWNRIPKGKAIGDILYKVEEDFDFKKPWKVIPQLLEAEQLIHSIEDEFWKSQKSKRIQSVIQACLGLFVEIQSGIAYANPGDDIQIEMELINRSPVDIQLKYVSLGGKPINVKQTVLKNNNDVRFSTVFNLSSKENYTTPYWLKEKAELGIYKVKNRALIGLPESPKPIQFTFNFEIEGKSFTLKKPLIYKYNDPVKGEVYQNFEILPEASLDFDKSVYVFKNSETKIIQVNVKAFKESVVGQLKLNLPNKWKISPNSHEVSLNTKGESKSFSFKITPSSISEAMISPELKLSKTILNKSVTTIEYDHIGAHNLIEEASAKLVNLDIKLSQKRIAYISGAGSSVASNLKDLGFYVKEFSPTDLTQENLIDFDVIIMGIRAYNIHESLAYKQSFIFEFVQNGGTIIVQYNTNRGLKTDEIAPFPMHMSRDRVTEETAEVRFLKPKHRVLNIPNKIDKSDFEGWVQERGLYFPDQWSEKLTPILSMNDRNETPKEGSILVGKYGKGHYIYTGLSFFRELPAGVPGAYKLLSNLISIE